MPWSILIPKTCSALSSILQVSDYYNQLNELIEVSYNVSRYNPSYTYLGKQTRNIAKLSTHQYLRF